MTNVGKARVRTGKRSTQEVQAAAKPPQILYKVKPRMGKVMKRAIPKEIAGWKNDSHKPIEQRLKQEATYPN